MTEDEQICGAIETIIQPGPTGFTTGVIWPYDALGHTPSEWPGLFRTSDGKTHGWIIKPAGFTGTRKNIVLDRRVRDFDIWAFLGFRQGTKTDNSSIEFSAILADAYERLKNEPHLGLDGIVERHELFQMPSSGREGGIKTIPCGEEILHFGPGLMTVHMCC